MFRRCEHKSSRTLWRLYETNARHFGSCATYLLCDFWHFQMKKPSWFLFSSYFLQMLGKKLLRKRATLQDIYRLYQVVIRVPKIVTLLEDLDCVTIKESLCGPMKDALAVSTFASKPKNRIVCHSQLKFQFPYTGTRSIQANGWANHWR